MSDNPDTTTNGISSTANGAALLLEPLDVATSTRMLTEYALAGTRVCVVSKGPGGRTLVATGKVVCVSEHVVIISRRKSGSGGDNARGRALAGEVFVRLETITRIERLHSVRGADK